MREMNPIYVIVVFVVILGALLYYLQSRENKSEQLSKAILEKSERNIIKADEYQAQYENEKIEVEPEKETVTILAAIETSEKILDEPLIEDRDISLLDGVGPKYQELLRTAGYNTIKSIAETTPTELYEELIKINNEKGITKRPPTMSNIEDWIKDANSR